MRILDVRILDEDEDIVILLSSSGPQGLGLFLGVASGFGCDGFECGRRDGALIRR
jgi:hypothetical protein